MEHKCGHFCKWQALTLLPVPKNAEMQNNPERFARKIENTIDGL